MSLCILRHCGALVSNEAGLSKFLLHTTPLQDLFGALYATLHPPNCLGNLLLLHLISLPLTIFRILTRVLSAASDCTETDLLILHTFST